MREFRNVQNHIKQVNRYQKQKGQYRKVNMDQVNVSHRTLNIRSLRRSRKFIATANHQLNCNSKSKLKPICLAKFKLQQKKKNLNYAYLNDVKTFSYLICQQVDASSYFGEFLEEFTVLANMQSHQMYKIITNIFNSSANFCNLT